MASTITRSGKAFAGMVYPDAHPTPVEDRWVTRVHMFDVPASLRQQAHESLNDLSGDQWWTVGEFRYEGDGEYETAVARRVVCAGRVTVEYGVEGV